MLKKEYLAKLLVVFGVATLITWIVNFVNLIIPFQFKVVKWIYIISQELSEKSIFPLIGILALMGGVYLCSAAKESQGSKCKCAVWAARLSSVLCIVFFAGLITMTVVYSLSIKPLQNDVKTQIMGEADKVKSQIPMMVQANPNLPQENLQRGMDELNTRVAQELKKAKRDIITNSIKILVGLISFALVNLVFAIYLIKISLCKNNCSNVNIEN